MALEHDSDSPLALAVRKAGSQSAFGRLIGKRQSVVHGWLADGVQYVPAEFVLVVEQALGIPCWEQNPEIYPPEKFAASPERGEAPAAVVPPSSSPVAAAGVLPAEPDADLDRPDTHQPGRDPLERTQS